MAYSREFAFTFTPECRRLFNVWQDHETLLLQLGFLADGPSRSAEPNNVGSAGLADSHWLGPSAKRYLHTNADQILNMDFDLRDLVYGLWATVFGLPGFGIWS